MRAAIPLDWQASGSSAVVLRTVHPFFTGASMFMTGTSKKRRTPPYPNPPPETLNAAEAQFLTSTYLVDMPWEICFDSKYQLFIKCVSYMTNCIIRLEIEFIQFALYSIS